MNHFPLESYSSFSQSPHILGCNNPNCFVCIIFLSLFTSSLSRHVFFSYNIIIKSLYSIFILDLILLIITPLVFNGKPPFLKSYIFLSIIQIISSYFEMIFLFSNCVVIVYSTTRGWWWFVCNIICISWFILWINFGMFKNRYSSRNCIFCCNMWKDRGGDGCNEVTAIIVWIT